MGKHATTCHPELISGSVILSLALFTSPLSAEQSAPHPDIPCWMGERAGSTTGGDFVIWDTENETKPYLITHDREQMREDGQLTQLDYNYLTYWFGDESAPIQARHYLYTYEVSLLLPSIEDRSLTLEEARQKIPRSVLCYLQKRYSSVIILTDKGYETLWEVRGSN